jgi:hypothetical protein
MKTIIIATFRTEADAGPLKQLFEQSHIPAEIQIKPALERIWMVDRPSTSVRVRVPARDHVNALRLMHAWDETAGVLRNAVRCPECGSLRVEYPQFTRKFVLPNLVGLLSALHLLEKEYYCEDCHCTWPKEGTPAPRSRAHMAPYYFIEDIPAAPPESAHDRAVHH